MVSVYTQPRLHSFEEYLAYDDGSERRYELLDTGELVELPNENDINVILAMDLYEYLKQFVSRHWVRMNATSIEVTPLSITLPNGRTRQIRKRSRIPDLMVLTELGAQQIHGRHSGLSLQQENPQLIVEFVSESNSDEDYTDKRAQYEARGIREYWIADRHQGLVTILQMDSDRYTENTYQGNECLQSAVFPGVALTAQQLLTEDSLSDEL